MKFFIFLLLILSFKKSSFEKEIPIDNDFFNSEIKINILKNDSMSENRSQIILGNQFLNSDVHSEYTDIQNEEYENDLIKDHQDIVQNTDVLTKEKIQYDQHGSDFAQILPTTNMDASSILDKIDDRCVDGCIEEESRHNQTKNVHESDKFSFKSQKIEIDDEKQVESTTEKIDFTDNHAKIDEDNYINNIGPLSIDQMVDEFSNNIKNLIFQGLPSVLINLINNTIFQEVLQETTLVELSSATEIKDSENKNFGKNIKEYDTNLTIDYEIQFNKSENLNFNETNQLSSESSKSDSVHHDFLRIATESPINISAASNFSTFTIQDEKNNINFENNTEQNQNNVKILPPYEFENELNKKNNYSEDFDLDSLIDSFSNNIKELIINILPEIVKNNLIEFTKLNESKLFKNEDNYLENQIINKADENNDLLIAVTTKSNFSYEERIETNTINNDEIKVKPDLSTTYTNLPTKFKNNAYMNENIFGLKVFIKSENIKIEKNTSFITQVCTAYTELPTINNLTIHWFINNSKVLQSNFTQIETMVSSYKPFTKVSMLKINHFNPIDFYNMSCIASLENSYYIEKKFDFLIINEETNNFLMTPEKEIIKVSSNKNINITCNFKNNLSGYIALLKDSKTLVFDHNTRFLSYTIKKVSEADGGNYSCLFNYSANQDINQTQIYLKSTNLIVDEYKLFKVNKNSTIQMHCYSSYNSSNEIYWLKRGSNIKLNEFNSKLLIIKDVDLIDSGVYECYTENKVGVKEIISRKNLKVINNNDYTLKTTVRDEKLTISEKINFIEQICSIETTNITDHDSLILRWFDNFGKMIINNPGGKYSITTATNNLKPVSKISILRIANLTEKDLGTYTCQGRIGFRYDVAKFEINLETLNLKI